MAHMWAWWNSDRPIKKCLHQISVFGQLNISLKSWHLYQKEWQSTKPITGSEGGDGNHFSSTWEVTLGCSIVPFLYAKVITAVRGNNQEVKPKSIEHVGLHGFFPPATQDLRPLPKVEPAFPWKQVKQAEQRLLLVHLTGYVILRAPTMLTRSQTPVLAVAQVSRWCQ